VERRFIILILSLSLVWLSWGALQVYLASKRPLPADEIAATLGIARSNVSNSLRELQNWGIIRVVHLMGDRRDHFESMKDVWGLFQTIMDERKRRELDPTLAVLKECVAAAKQSRRPHLPEVTEPMTTREVCVLIADADLAVVLHEHARRPLAELPVPASGTVVVVVGPEGGLTDGEVVAFRAAGAHAVRLGPEVLRTSTAGAAALAALSARTRWG